HLLDRGVGQIEQRQGAVLLRSLGAVLLRGFGVFRRGRFGLGRCCLGGHAALACHALSLHGRFFGPLPYGDGITSGRRPTPRPGRKPQVPCCWAAGLEPTAKRGGCRKGLPPGTARIEVESVGTPLSSD